MCGAGRWDGYSDFHGTLSGASATNTALPLGPWAFPYPELPLPSQTHHRHHHHNPSSPPGQKRCSETRSFVYNLICPQLCTSLCPHGSGLGPLLHWFAEHYTGNSLSAEGGSARLGVTVHKALKGPPHPLPSAQKAHPQPPRSGEQEGGQAGPEPDAGSVSGPPATPRAERSPPGTSEPCGSRTWPYLQTPGDGRGLQARHRMSPRPG